jgi:hypothetical protein
MALTVAFALDRKCLPKEPLRLPLVVELVLDESQLPSAVATSGCSLP